MKAYTAGLMVVIPPPWPSARLASAQPIKQAVLLAVACLKDEKPHDMGINWYLLVT
jgi:hypothetical protein